MLEDAVIYKAMFDASQGRMSPRDTDELLLWEIATLLGAADELQSKEDGSTTDDSPQSRADARRALLKARVDYARGIGPKPEAKAMDPAAFTAMTKALR